MKHKTKLLIVYIFLIFIITLGTYLIVLSMNTTPNGNNNTEGGIIVGASCGTVSPNARDQCCYRKFIEEGKFPKCLDLLISFNLNTQECEAQCGGAKDKICTQDAMQCPDGTWTSRTGVLNCQFIPCGDN